MTSPYSAEEFLDIPAFVKTKFPRGAWRTNQAAVQVAIGQQFYASPMFAMRNFFYTVSKENEIVRLDPWRGQLIHHTALESQRKRGLPRRVVEIKARQVGFTAWNLGYAFWATMHPRNKTLVLVDDEEVATSLTERVGEMYNNLPKWLRPMKRIHNPREIIFDNPNVRDRGDIPGLASRFTVTVPASLRGNTPNVFIWSEAAFCKEWEIVVDGVLGGIAPNKNSCVIIDTTPNGHDPFYKPLVYEAVERNPKWAARWERKGPPSRDEIIAGLLGEPDRPRDGFVPSFCPWHWHEEYTTKDEEPVYGQLEPLEPQELQHLKATLGKCEEYGGEEELELVKRYGVSLYRLYWRRWKLDNDTMGADHWERLLTFRQEYMSRWDAGFVTFGRGAFDARGLDKLYRYIPGGRYGVRGPLVRGAMVNTPRGIAIDTTWQSPYLEVRIWALPEPGEQYVIGVDTGTAFYSEDGDRTVAQIVRRRDRKQVGIMTARVPEHEYREQIKLLYRWYNNAYLGIEMENDGYSLAHNLLKEGVENQYYYRRYDVSLVKPPTDGLGWETNQKTRSFLQGQLVEGIAHKEIDGAGVKQPAPSFVVCDELTMRELMDVTRDPYGKIANFSGGHDDCMMALGIALAIDADHWNPYHPATPKQKEQQLNALVARMGLNVPGSSSRNSPNYAEL